MSVSPQQIADEAKLFRQSGHPNHSARLLSVARTHFPTEDCLAKEERRLLADEKKSLKGFRRIVTAAVDLLGLPVFLAWFVLGFFVLTNLLFMPAG